VANGMEKDPQPIVVHRLITMAGSVVFIVVWRMGPTEGGQCGRRGVITFLGSLGRCWDYICIFYDFI